MKGKDRTSGEETTHWAVFVKGGACIWGLRGPVALLDQNREARWVSEAADLISMHAQSNQANNNAQRTTNSDCSLKESRPQHAVITTLKEEKMQKYHDNKNLRG